MESETRKPDEQPKLESTVFIIVTESERDGQKVRTVSRVRKFPESLITALPRSVGEKKAE